MADKKIDAEIQTMTLMDVIDRMPPSLVQVLAMLAPAVHAVHRFLLLVTWRGGYAMRVQSWLLLVSYVLACLYGYEILRYAPQMPILMWIAYAWLTRSFDRVSGRRRDDTQNTVQTIKDVVSELADISDFFAALRECVFYPIGALLSWDLASKSTSRLAVFLLASWPFWLLCVMPTDFWTAPMYHVSTTWAQLRSTPPMVWLSAFWSSCVYPRAVGLLERWAPSLLIYVQHLCFLIHTHVAPYTKHVNSVATSVLTRATLTWQVFPPFPIASLTVRHMVLMVGVVALTWCAPWAALIRAALWRSAFIRHSVLHVVRVLSGSESVVQVFAKPLQAPIARTSNAVHETEFVFEVYENQRWWIGLDWTAALLPQERPSWSDVDNQAVAPPSSFSLPRTVRTLLPSATQSGKYDARIASWRWTDVEWHVAGVPSITSNTYTPAASMTALEAQRISEKRADEKPPLPEEIKRVAKPVAEASDTSEVDEDGWQYGDNAWDKLSRQNGMGRYTRRRRWVRRAILSEAVEYGVERN